LANVASLPGIVQAAYAMTDAHWGYGFPIGGVAAFDPDEGGVASGGGVGFDISCGVRTLHTGLDRAAILAVRRELADALCYRAPVGLSTSWPPAPSARVTATDRAGLARLVARLEPPGLYQGVRALGGVGARAWGCAGLSEPGVRSLCQPAMGTPGGQWIASSAITPTGVGSSSARMSGLPKAPSSPSR
jgi:hypothetical protein